VLPLAPPSIKEIVEALIVLKRVVQHHADEIGFEQHYSYENMITQGCEIKSAKKSLGYIDSFRSYDFSKNSLAKSLKSRPSQN